LLFNNGKKKSENVVIIGPWFLLTLSDGSDVPRLMALI